MIELISKRRLSTATSSDGQHLVNQRTIVFNFINFFIQFYIFRIFKVGVYAVFSWIESYTPGLYYLLFVDKVYNLVRYNGRNQARALVVKWFMGMRNTFGTISFAVISLFISMNSFETKKQGDKVVTFQYLEIVYSKVAEYFPDILYLVYYLSIASVFLASFKILYDHKKNDLVLTLERKHGISIGNSLNSKICKFSANPSDFFTEIKKEINYHGFVDMDDFILIEDMSQTRDLQFQIHMKKHILRHFQVPVFLVKDLELERVHYDYYRSFRYVVDVNAESSGYSAAAEVLVVCVVFLLINVLLIMMAGSLFGISQTDYSHCLAAQCTSSQTGVCDYYQCSSTTYTQVCSYYCNSSCQHDNCSTFSRNMLCYTALIIYNLLHGIGNVAILLNAGGIVVTTLTDSKGYTDLDHGVLADIKNKKFFRVMAEFLDSDDDAALLLHLCRVHYGAFSFVDVAGIQLDKLLQLLNLVAVEKSLNYQLYYNPGGNETLQLVYSNSPIGAVDIMFCYNSRGDFSEVSKVSGVESSVVIDYLPLLV